ncbi:DNA-binding protein, YbaB/EbfC family [Alloiococcus otitis]|uniref:Nucleoid-associated protein HMPREF9698_01083 n=1 Tax=Alloiococcus otitis ATCC 51267 TaxID=883081 RepID=K9EVY2_9LACT|nr:YbaB/EbfC family nucleoid-associated protein [Alloiococcus otitis]EKU93335.1 YbaB/EbfC family DNA-binding protein [Alloiococcus otitis ATCC 51267]SUU81552.1 DNA-binding protein, YbaB/EbfC family [Alloiococcus otitis]
MRGMGNMQGMMKKMKKMQKEMEEAQTKLNESQFTGSANNDLVQVTLNGEKKVQAVTIKEEIVDPEDKEIIEDLVQLAMNDALDKVDQETERVMGKYTKGLGGLPGF